MAKYLFLLFSIIYIGCKPSDKEHVTYFGGKIINPKGTVVLLSNYNGLIDSIPLKDDHTFMVKFENLPEGLYYFEHGPEFQYVYLEPNDSLLIRLNTWDFDESIVFSGKNAIRNNALIELFLQNEIDDRAFYKYYQLNTPDFKTQIDSLLRKKESFINNYKNQNNTESEQFLTVLEMASKYPVYKKIERYSIYKAEKGNIQQLDKSILNYRNAVNLQQDSLLFFTPYSDLIINKIYNDTYLQGYQKNTDEFEHAVLTNIDRQISLEDVKNKLLNQIALGSFYSKNNRVIDSSFFTPFFNLCTNDDYKNRLKALIKDANSLNQTTQLPSFTLIAFDGGIHTIDELINNKNTVLYFRNPKHTSGEWVSSRLRYLIKNNPNVHFFLINMNNLHDYDVRGVDLKCQYYLPSNSTAHQFLTSGYSRVVLVDKNGVIKNGFDGLSSKNINQQIADLSKHALK